MSERNWRKAVFGGVTGLILGIFVAVSEMFERSSREGPPSLPGQTVGWDPISMLHVPEFWFIVIVCTVVFAFIAGRIGRPTHHSDL